jgi:hypothetical protein
MLPLNRFNAPREPGGGLALTFKIDQGHKNRFGGCGTKLVFHRMLEMSRGRKPIPNSKVSLNRFLTILAATKDDNPTKPKDPKPTKKTKSTSKNQR